MEEAQQKILVLHPLMTLINQAALAVQTQVVEVVVPLTMSAMVELVVLVL
jgi:hypothetical protein